MMQEAILIHPLQDMEGWVVDRDEYRGMVKFLTRIGKVSAWHPEEDVRPVSWSHA
jgi:hypothetical protein